MGLRDHEFDVAPELLAALLMGVLDSRNRAEIDRVSGQIESFLRDVGRLRGSAGRVRGEGRQGPAIDDEPSVGSSRGPRGGVGLFDGRSQSPQTVVESRRPWGTSVGAVPNGRIARRDSPVADKRGWVGMTPEGESYPDSTLTPAEQRRVAIKAALNVLFNDPLVCDRTCNRHARADAIRELYRLLNNGGGRTPKDDDSGSGGPSTAVDWWALSAYLKSLGGLGEASISDGLGRANGPNILDAVDPAPDSEGDDTSVSATIAYWMLNLIDPTPDL